MDSTHNRKVRRNQSRSDSSVSNASADSTAISFRSRPHKLQRENSDGKKLSQEKNKKLSKQSSSSSTSASTKTNNKLQHKNSSGSCTSSSSSNLPNTFSGWVYVATSKNGKYRNRYCRLRDALCTFYDNPQCPSNDSNKHIVLSVTKDQEVNQGLILVNHNKKKIYMYTEFSEEYDMWLNAFIDAVIAYNEDDSIRSRTLKNLPIQRTIDLTANEPKCDRSPSKQVECSGWLEKECRGLFSTKNLRRYFVLVGTRISYFDVNVEGKKAEGSGNVTSFKALKSYGLLITLDSKKTFRVIATCEDEIKLWEDSLANALKQDRIKEI